MTTETLVIIIVATIVIMIIVSFLKSKYLRKK
jgi:hypothetical protein